MTIFYESQFVGYIQQISELIDVVHMGIGLDIFFCGHYMAKYHPVVLGRPSLHFKTRNIEVNRIENEFMENKINKKVFLDLENKVANSGRILIRASGTENLIRLLIEHKNSEEINKLEKHFCDNIQKT